jgi:hypothetical protein
MLLFYGFSPFGGPRMSGLDGNMRLPGAKRGMSIFNHSDVRNKFRAAASKPWGYAACFSEVAAGFSDSRLGRLAMSGKTREQSITIAMTKIAVW